MLALVDGLIPSSIVIWIAKASGRRDHSGFDNFVAEDDTADPAALPMGLNGGGKLSHRQAAASIYSGQSFILMHQPQCDTRAQLGIFVD